MTSAVSVMSPEEQNLQEDDPDLLRAQQMTGSIRWLELYRSYLLAERLEKEPRQRHPEIIQHWAISMGMTPATLASHLGWARAIDLQLLADTFEGEGIGEKEWTQRIGTSHLKEIAKAKDQTTHQVATPGQMVDLVIETYHANWSVAELLEELRKRNLRAPARGMNIAPTKNLTACQLGIAMFTDLQKRGADVDLNVTPENWGKPRKVFAILESLAAKFRTEDMKETTWAPTKGERK